MDSINFVGFLTFVVITTFTPGPNNISSSSMGVLYGYPKTLRYIGGIVTGFFVIMLVAGIISNTLYTILPSVETIMRIIGAGYILWLAYKTVKSSYQFSTDDNEDEHQSPTLGYINGLMLQALNPKVWIYALTLYTSFLASITNNIIFLIFSALFLASVAFCTTSSWAIMGALIKRYLSNPKIQRIVNIILGLLLVYTAIDLSGIFH